MPAPAAAAAAATQPVGADVAPTKGIAKVHHASSECPGEGGAALTTA